MGNNLSVILNTGLIGYFTKAQLKLDGHSFESVNPAGHFKWTTGNEATEKNQIELPLSLPQIGYEDDNNIFHEGEVLLNYTYTEYTKDASNTTSEKKSIQIKYIFLGWYFDSDKTKPAYGSYKIDTYSDLTLYAKWGWAADNNTTIVIEHSNHTDGGIILDGNNPSNPFIKSSDFLKGNDTYTCSVPYLYAERRNDIHTLTLREELFGDLPVKATLTIDLDPNDHGWFKLGSITPRIKDNLTNCIEVWPASNSNRSVNTTLSTSYQSDYHLALKNTTWGYTAVTIKNISIKISSAPNVGDERPHNVSFTDSLVNEELALYENQRTILPYDYWPIPSEKEGYTLTGWTINDKKTISLKEAESTYSKERINSGETYITSDTTFKTKYMSSANTAQIIQKFGKDLSYTLTDIITKEAIAEQEKCDINSINFADENFNTLLLKYIQKIPTAHSCYIDNNTTYVFKEWQLKSCVISTSNSFQYTYEAVYQEKVSGYTQSWTDFLTVGEPYHYGPGSPLKNWYLPIGEDSDELTFNDLKIQAPEDNGYSEIGYVEGYQIEGKNIPYIKKGTFPLAGENHIIYRHEELSGKDSSSTGKYNQKDSWTHHTAVIFFTEDSNNYPDRVAEYCSIWEPPTTSPATHYTTPSNRTYFDSNDGYKDGFISKHSFNNQNIKRLGFMLVGAGGGGGGSSWYYERNKAKKKTSNTVSFPYPGSGGGGGGILIGALLIDPIKIKKAFDLAASTHLDWIDFIFSVGIRGYRGDNYTTTNSMSYGSNGVAGDDTALVGIELCYRESAEAGVSSRKYKCKVFTDIKALGGAGGAAGNHSQPVRGGLGGGYQFPKSNNINKNCVYIAKGVKGGNGSDCDKESDQNNAPAFKCDLYLSNTDASNTDHCFKIDHPTRASVTDISENTDPSKFDLNNTTVAGGSSYGNGAYRDSSGPHAADIGGGGSSGGDGFTSDSNESQDLRYGGGGAVILFY